jgi:uncharacterized membrane protein
MPSPSNAPPVIDPDRAPTPPIKFIGLGAIVLFFFSSLQHGWFRSGAWDLGIFDQAVYLISQGQPPISSFLGFHILGDHAAYMFYALALLYKIYPDVHWLLAVQAIALALGALPTWLLARQAGLAEKQATSLAIVYLLSPIVFNANLADFHPEVIAVPAILFAVLAAQSQRLFWFCLCLAIALICRDALALNIAAMGLWLLLFEKRRKYGAIALIVGIAWFLLATQVIVPAIGGDAAKVDRFLFRYAWLGSSYGEIAKNFFLQPGLVAQKILSWNTVGYLLVLGSPVVWAMRPQQFAPLIGAFPTLAMNLLSSNNGQRSLVGQYSVPVLPFLMLVVIAASAAHPVWRPKRRLMIAWATIGFLVLAKYGLFFTYLDTLDTWTANRSAIAQIQTRGNVLTDHNLAPHLTHRPIVDLISQTQGTRADLDHFKYVLITLRHPWLDARQPAIDLLNQVKTSPQFKLSYEKDEVYLFEKEG